MKNRNAKEDFICAFWILYEKKTIEKISIRELCELAGYNRSTFYAHFQDIFDLLEQFIKVKVLPDTFPVDVSLLASDVLLIQKIMAYFFEKNNYYVQVILRNHHGYILQEIILSRIKQLLPKERKKEFEYAVRYQISAILGVFEFWYQQGEEQITEQQLLTLLYEITTKGVLNSFIDTLK